MTLTIRQSLLGGTYISQQTIFSGSKLLNSFKAGGSTCPAPDSPDHVQNHLGHWCLNVMVTGLQHTYPEKVNNGGTIGAPGGGKVVLSCEIPWQLACDIPRGSV